MIVRYFCAFLCALGVSSSLFGHSFQDKEVPNATRYIKDIVTEASDIIKYRDGDRFYLEESKVFDAGGCEYCLTSYEWDILIHKDLVFSDNYGPYLSISPEKLAQVGNKIFRNVCYNCGFRWPGSCFAVSCPRCRSTNIGSELNE